MTKKLLALLLALAMCLSLLPTVALANCSTIEAVLATVSKSNFPTEASAAWVCESDRNKVIYKDNDGSKLVIVNYSSGSFSEESGFNCPTASEVTWNEEEEFYSCELEDYRTIKFKIWEVMV